jgi:hypothetical protein
MLRVKLKFRDMETPPVLAVLDTGADRCMFDHRLALLVGVNVYQAGASNSATGIGGREEISVFPIEVEFPDLNNVSWEIFAQFKTLPDGINGILGHAGFLGRMKAAFSYGKEFELSEIKA